MPLDLAAATVVYANRDFGALPSGCWPGKKRGASNGCAPAVSKRRRAPGENQEAGAESSAGPRKPAAAIVPDADLTTDQDGVSVPTWTLTVAVTSRKTFTVTGYSPSARIDSARCTWRLSTLKPWAARPSAMSAEVTEPNI